MKTTLILIMILIATMAFGSIRFIATETINQTVRVQQTVVLMQFMVDVTPSSTEIDTLFSITIVPNGINVSGISNIGISNGTHFLQIQVVPDSTRQRIDIIFSNPIVVSQYLNTNLMVQATACSENEWFIFSLIEAQTSATETWGLPISGSWIQVVNVIGNVLNVPTQFPTIQSAIYAASVGDTVLVDEGIYYEKLNFWGTGITVMSNFGINHNESSIQNTVISGIGGLAESIIRFYPGTQYQNDTLLGFRIINGNANLAPNDSYGGALRIIYSSPIIKNCIIMNNYANSYGGGIYIQNGHPRLQNCLIAENYSNNGAGICVQQGSVEIINCTITNNIARSPQNSVIFGGLYLSSGSRAVIGNSIIWNNKKAFTNTGYEEAANVGFCFAFTADTLIVVCSDIQGGVNAIDTENNGTIHWLDWNIDEDPELDQDYKPEIGSPCIDAGHDLFYWNGVQIINLYPNQYYGNSPDMGFWETYPVSNNDSIIPIANIPVLNQNYPNPFNPETTISFNLPKAGEMSLQIFNIKGQLIKTLFNGQKFTGSHQITWNGTDNSGNYVASGVYYYKMRTGKYSSTKKMILMK
ncbi:MAG: FlgD immunoglobulin-like domain containing protein [Patescibacteria group bacterium]|nr:FlgD immunoglobulin-like domain containing protein [Patescibacteria group bacterium]MDD4304487.1 FlgD immunoglobulin-like domain containing protein [Patescibacteria group bacterium]MDD4694847.1 FlgD immunoglobulin-like domain containing protein [Patescibacteria group bacterium]